MTRTPGRPMTTAELDANWAAAHADHEGRLRTLEAAVLGAPPPPVPQSQIETPRAIPWPAARVPVADVPPPADPATDRFVTLGRALAGTAHDLNNLLAVVHGYAELLMEELAGDPRRESAVGIQAAADLAAGVVKQLLAVARPTAGTPPRTDVGLHLTRLERLLKAVLASGAGVRLTVDHGCGAAFAAVVPADVTQVVLNLAVNARDAMPDGGEVLVRTGLAQGGPGGPAGLPAGHWVEVAVADTGPGLDPAARRGEGLGLMTVGDILARCGGHLLLESAPGDGTRARVFLPRA